MFVVATSLIVVTRLQTVAIATTVVPVTRAMAMVAVDIDYTLASFLYSLPFKSTSACLTACLADDNCYYLWINQMTESCSYYSQGSTTYPTVGNIVYVLESMVEHVRI